MKRKPAGKKFIPPLVSIIIPIYNTEEFLAECLDSVVSQTLKNLEIICVNDGSMDGSVAIVEKYAAKDQRFRMIDYGGNRGSAHARNSGLEAARGKYIYFMDSDDILQPEAMEELFNIAEADELDLVLFNTDVLYALGELSDNKAFSHVCQTRHQYEGIFTGAEMYTKMLAQGDYSPYPWLQFWRKDSLVHSGVIFNTSLRTGSDDELFYFQAILQVQRVRHVPKAYYIYRRREGSLTAQKIEDYSRREFHKYLIVYCERLHALAHAGNHLSPEARQTYCSELVYGDFRHLQNHYFAMKDRSPMSFDNLAHEIFYRRFCEEMESKRRFSSLIAVLGQKKLVFLGTKNFIDQVCRTFRLAAENYRVLENEKNIIHKETVLGNMENASFHLFFIPGDGYGNIVEWMREAGMVENEDFMNGCGFLT